MKYRALLLFLVLMVLFSSTALAYHQGGLRPLTTERFLNVGYPTQTYTTIPANEVTVVRYRRNMGTNMIRERFLRSVPSTQKDPEGFYRPQSRFLQEPVTRATGATFYGKQFRTRYWARIQSQ